MNLRSTGLSITFFIFLSVSFSSWQSNPFDIKSRSNADSSVVVPVVQETISVAAPKQIDTQIDTFTPDSGETETRSKTDDSFLERQQKRIIEENPFNVSHIPIKRNINEIKPPKPKKKNKVSKQAGNNTEKQDSSLQISEIDLSELKNVPTNKFVFWLILFKLLIITSVLSLNREIIQKIYRSISNDNFAKLVARDYNNGFNALFLILNLVFLFSFSTFIYLVLRHFYEIDGILRFLYILSAVFGVYFIRHSFLGFLSWTFPNQRSTTYYNFMVIIFNNFLGLLLIPINVVIAYAPFQLSIVALYIGIFMVIAMFLLRFLRGSFHAYSFIRGSIFHFFLYLCTCELAPVVILVKLLTKFFFN